VLKNTSIAHSVSLACRDDLCFSGSLRSVDWQLVTEVSGKIIVPILKGKAVEEKCL